MKKETFRNTNIRLIVFVLFVFCVAGCGSSDPNTPSGSAGPSNQTPYSTAIAAADLYNAYKKDPKSAAEQYKGKPVRITGQIFSATDKSSTGEPVAVFDVDNRDGVSCKFAEQQKDAVAKLQKGETKTFKCRVNDPIVAGDSVTVSLGDCRVE